MGIFVYLAIQIGIFAIQYWLMPALQKKEVPKYANLQDLQLPRAQRGAVVPLIFGRILVRGGNLDYIGKLAHRPIYDGGVVVDYSYKIPFRMVLGIPAGQYASLANFYVNDVSNILVPLHGTTNIDQLAIPTSPPSIYAGYFYGGSFTEPPGSTDAALPFAQLRWSYFLDSVLIANSADSQFFSPLVGCAWMAFWLGIGVDPNAPDQVGAQFGGWEIGPPQPPPYAMELIACADKYLDPTIRGIGPGEINPATLIYDLLTNGWGRCGIDPALIDTASFIAAATTLQAEGHGMSGILYNNDNTDKIIEDICKQIDALTYQDPVTGLYTIKLVRDDYTVGSLPVFSDALGNLIDVTSFATQAWSETYNEARVVFNNRALGYNDDVAHDQDMANFYMQSQRPRATTVTYQWVTDAVLAQKLASRELRAVSRPLRRAKIVVDRSGYTLRAGGLFRFTYSRYNLTDVVFRIGRVDMGQLFDGKITIEAVEDIFAVDKTPFQIPPVQINPFPLATPLTVRILDEAPRWLELQAAAAGRISSADSQRLWYLAAPNANDLTMRGTVSPDGFIFANDGGRTTFPPTALLIGFTYAREAEPYDTTIGFTVGSLVGAAPSSLNAGYYTVAQLINLLGANLLRIGNEIVAVETWTDNGDGTYTASRIWRGLMDTVPIAHPVGTRIYFLTRQDGLIFATTYFDMNQIGVIPMATGTSIIGQIVPFDVWGAISPLVDQPTNALTVAGRVGMPYPVANLTLGGSKTPAAEIVDSIDVAWSERLSTSPTLTRGDSGAETVPGTDTFQVNAKMKGLDPLPRVTVRGGIAATVYAAAIALGIAGHGTVGVSVRSYRSGVPLHSWQDPEIDVTAPHWRNLVQNGDFATNTSGWTVAAGTLARGTTNALGGAGAYGIDNSGLAETADFSQTINVAGYRADGMSALGAFYGGGFTGATGDQIIFSIEALNSGGGHLGTTQTTTVTPPATTGLWTRYELPYTGLPAGTVFLKVRVQLKPASSGTPNTRITRISLRVGQPTSQLISNAGFETGTLGSWTTVSGAFSVNTTDLYEVSNVAQCDTAGTLRQDVTITAGWEYATAVLECGRGQASNLGSSTDWPAEVKLQALDGSNNVLATATTGSEIIGAGAGHFLLRTLSLDLPTGTAKIRVDWVVTNASNHKALLDDVRVRLWKHLAPDASIDATFATPSLQPTPSDANQWLAEATFAGVPAPDLIHSFAGARPSYGSADMIARGTHLQFDGKCVGPIAANGAVSTTCLEFPGGSAGAEYLEVLSDATIFNFATAGSFSVVALVRLDGEANPGAARGILGRMSAIGLGWSLELDDATRCPIAILGGATSTKSIVGAVTITDGALHQVAIVYNAATNLLHCIDENGTDHSVSTAGMGEIAVNGEFFRIGLSNAIQSAMQGQIARVYVWDGTALSAAQIGQLWGHAKDTTGVISSSTITDPWALPMPSDPDGVLLGHFSAAQFPLAYDTHATAGYALPLQATATNLIPTQDFRSTGGHLALGSGAQITYDKLGPDGFLNAINIHHTGGGSSTDYFEINGITLGAGNPTVQWFFRNPAGLNVNVKVELVNASNVLKDTYTYSATGLTTWQAASHTFTWDNSTPTGKLRFYSASAGNTLDLHLSPLIGVFQLGANVVTPIGIPIVNAGTGGAVSARYTINTAAPTVQHNAEGEIFATIRLSDSSRVAGTIANVRNASNSNDRRCLRVGATSPVAITFDHYDGAAAANTAATTVADWSTDYLPYRGRWSRSGMLDDSAHFSNLITAPAGTPVATAGRASIWTQGAVAPARIDLGHSNGSDLITGFLRRVRLTTRECATPIYPISDVGPPGSGVGGGALA